MSSKAEKIKNMGNKKKKQLDFHSIKSKFDLPTLLMLPITSITILLFSKSEIQTNPVNSILTSLFLMAIGRTCIMYYANYKRKANQRRQLVSILNALCITLVFACVMLFFCLLVKVSLKSKFFELVSSSLYVATLAMYPAAFVVGTDFESWTKMFSITEIFSCNRDEISVGAPLLGTLIGAWLSALAIPLDWGKWWQPFPISTVLFSVLGNIIGSVIGILFYIFKKDSVPLSPQNQGQGVKKGE